MDKIITGQVVTLVTYPEFLSVLEIPHFGEYDNPRILKLTPCAKDGNGKYTDLRSGKEVKKKPNMLEWLNLSGTVFTYPDGVNLLVSSNMMPRRVVDRRKKTDLIS